MSDIFWTIYLGIWAVVSISYFVKGGYKAFTSNIDFAVSIITWIGLSGYVTSRELGDPLIWKIVFVGGLMWDILFGYKQFTEDAGEINKTTRPILFVLTGLIIIGPLYYGLFQYAF